MIDKFKVGDDIICIKDCYDDKGVKLHSVGEKNTICVKPSFGITWYIEISNRSILNNVSVQTEHFVDSEYLSKYFLPKCKYRNLQLINLLNKK